ncbi:CRISPR-associated endonuclease Cas1 [Nitrosopumilus sp.]|uniref:CRISPR-associated endonuclease Cas1 n=1 Tax=Nitrosopumilus sp. TaxID=2024843 RepID=UPI0034A07FCA
MQNATTHRVKLLRGYGIGITLKDNQIVLKNGRHFYEKEHEIESYFPSRFPYQRIVISGRGILSTESIKSLSENNVNIILTDSYGNAVSSMNFPMVSGIGSRNRMSQYDTFRDDTKATYLQRQLLHAKFESQIRFLSSLNEDCTKVISTLKEQQRIIPNLDLRKMVTVEAHVSREYFKLYTSFFDEKYGFDSRRGFVGNTKQNATDVINALLNYGYTVLAGEITKQIVGIGLDPYYSFYHKNHESFQSLTYDLIEPFRWIVEKTVYRLGNAKNKKLQIKKTDYIKHDKSGMVLLDTELVKKFLEMLEVDFRKTREYDRKNGMKKENGLSNCAEITIVKIVIQNLSDFCNGKSDEFRI